MPNLVPTTAKHVHRTFAHLSKSCTPQIHSSSSSRSPDVMFRHCLDPAPSYWPAIILPHVPVPVPTHSIRSIHPVTSLSCVLITFYVNELWSKVIKVGYVRYQLSKQHNTASSIINYYLITREQHGQSIRLWIRFVQDSVLEVLWLFFCIQNVCEIMTLAWVTLDSWWTGLFKWYETVLEASTRSIANWNFTSRQSIVNEDLIGQTVSRVAIVILGSRSP